jgi:DNA invertase Pin-like site-specific DNA recombinase
MPALCAAAVIGQYPATIKLDRPIAGTRLIREWRGVEHWVTVQDEGYEYQGRPYQSLSDRASDHRNALEWLGLLRAQESAGAPMKKPIVRKLSCAVYTRKSTEEGLEMEFNSLDAQREACEAYVASQTAEGWVLVPDRYDDGGFSGAMLKRPALQRLLADIEAHRIDIVIVYKIDRLSRALMDFAKLVEVFDRNKVTFVSVTQSFCTTNSMGRLTLNILLSFAQFEREVIGERIRDKFAASRKKGIWMGGWAPLGYDVRDRKLVINKAEAARVRMIFKRFAGVGSATSLTRTLIAEGVTTRGSMKPSLIKGCGPACMRSWVRALGSVPPTPGLKPLPFSKASSSGPAARR